MLLIIVINEFTVTLAEIIAVFAMKITCFILGYKVVKLGYNLMVEGVKGNFNFTTEFKGIKAGLASASPGLLFLLLGVVLISFSLDIKKEYKVKGGDTTTQTNDSTYADTTKVTVPKITIDTLNDTL